MESSLHKLYEDGCKPFDKLKTQLNYKLLDILF